MDRGRRDEEYRGGEQEGGLDEMVREEERMRHGGKNREQTGEKLRKENVSE